MPIIESAIKKLRKDKKRTLRNRGIKRRYKELMKKALDQPTDKNIRAAVAAIDKAGKRRVIHKNKAARLKSRVMRAKEVEPKGEEEKRTKTKTKTGKKSKKRAKKGKTKIDRKRLKK